MQLTPKPCDMWIIRPKVFSASWIGLPLLVGSAVVALTRIADSSTAFLEKYSVRVS